MQKSDNIYTNRFWLLSFSVFFFITSFNLIIPELMPIMRHYGGDLEKGLAITFFALAALIARPFSGKLVDVVGRKPIIIVGGIVCFIMGLVYPLADTLYVFLFFRFIHGFSTGFSPVGNMSYMADIVPAHRRGEAMGIMGMMVSLGFPVGMTLGSWIADLFDWNMLFYISSIFALISILLVSQLKETLPNTKRFKPRMLLVKWDDVFEPRIIVPFIIMIIVMYSFGAANVLMFDQSTSAGFSDTWKSTFFIATAAISVILRYPAGRMSDRYGRRKVAMVGYTVMITALTCMAYADDKATIIAAGILYGMSTGINSPNNVAWAVDLADPKRIGRAMSTMFIAIEIGVGIGGFIAGLLTASVFSNFFWVYIIGAGLALFAVFVCFFAKSGRKTPISQQ